MSCACRTTPSTRSRPARSQSACEKIEARGEIAADVVVVEGARKETLRLFGTPYAVNRVRAALFNAAVSWTQIELD